MGGAAFTLHAAPPPGSLERLVPLGVLWIWYGLLLVGGAVGLAGAWWPRLLTGLLLERASMFMLSAGCCMYVVALVGSAGVAATAAAGFIASMGAACAVRLWQIWRDVRLVRAVAWCTDETVIDGDP